MNDQPTDQHDEFDHDHDHESSPFVATLSRRAALGGLAALGISMLAACGKSEGAGSSSSTTTTTPATTPATTTAAASSETSAEACLVFPEETNGPFPADGSNDNGAGAEANVLADARIVRSDLTANLDGSDQQPGIPLELTMLIAGDDACTPLAGAAVYVWHCSRDGHYSVYDSQMNGGDYSASQWFRGVQIADAKGSVTFETIFPGRYQGRATHIHFEVYEDDTYANLLLTSQIGFEDDDADAVYQSDSNYASSLQQPTYNANDNVFSDGDGSQIVDIADPATTLSATVAISV